MRCLTWDEYRLHERFIQKNPWRWGVTLKKKKKKDQHPDDPDAEPKPKKKPKKKTDKRYEKVMASHKVDSRSGGSYE